MPSIHHCPFLAGAAPLSTLLSAGGLEEVEAVVWPLDVFGFNLQVTPVVFWNPETNHLSHTTETMEIHTRI